MVRAAWWSPAATRSRIWCAVVVMSARLVIHWWAHSAAASPESPVWMDRQSDGSRRSHPSGSHLIRTGPPLWPAARAVCRPLSLPPSAFLGELGLGQGGLGGGLAEASGDERAGHVVASVVVTCGPLCLR